LLAKKTINKSGQKPVKLNHSWINMPTLI